MLIFLATLFYGAVFCVLGLGWAFWKVRNQDQEKNKKKRRSTRRSTLIKGR